MVKLILLSGLIKVRLNICNQSHFKLGNEREAMSLLDNQDVKEIAGKVFDNAQVLNWEVSEKSKEIIGYLGNHLTLTIRAQAHGKEVRRVFFIKTYNVQENKEDFIGQTGIFQKEVDFYRELVKDVAELTGQPVWCPRYYYSKKRVLVLDDLSEKGFTMAPDNLNLDKPHLEAALRALSSMHAASLLLEHRNAQPLNLTYPHIFKEILYDENKPEAPSRKWISWQIQDLSLGIEYLDKYTSTEKNLIRNRFVDEVMKIYPLSKPSQRYPNVIIHGDVWRNNLMFRYGGGVPLDCRFVDFQFSRYAPPAHDIMHLLHYATKKPERHAWESHYFRFYYDTLKGDLRTRGRDVEEVLTWSDFLESCREYRELALIQTLLSSHYILGPATLDPGPGTYQKYEDYLSTHRKSYMKEFFHTPSYVDKITDILCELIDNYIMDKS